MNGTQVGAARGRGLDRHLHSALHIGGNSVWGEWFNGTIDEVRVYNRALSAAEIQNDMVRSITPDTVAPTITARTPAPGSAGINAGTSATATFNELMGAGSLHRLELPAQGRAQRRRPDERHVRPGDAASRR